MYMSARVWVGVQSGSTDQWKARKVPLCQPDPPNKLLNKRGPSYLTVDWNVEVLAPLTNVKFWPKCWFTHSFIFVFNNFVVYFVLLCHLSQVFLELLALLCVFGCICFVEVKLIIIIYFRTTLLKRDLIHGTTANLLYLSLSTMQTIHCLILVL